MTILGICDYESSSAFSLSNKGLLKNVECLTT